MRQIGAREKPGINPVFVRYRGNYSFQGTPKMAAVIVIVIMLRQQRGGRDNSELQCMRTVHYERKVVVVVCPVKPYTKSK